MNTLQNIFRAELDRMDHRPEQVYDGQWFRRWPKVSWGNIRERLLNHLETQVDLDTVPEKLVEQTLQDSIREMKDSQWAEDMLWEARHWRVDQQQKINNPYRYHGVERSFFL